MNEKEMRKLGDEYRADWSSVDGRELQAEFHACADALKEAEKNIIKLEEKLKTLDWEWENKTLNMQNKTAYQNEDLKKARTRNKELEKWIEVLEDVLGPDKVRELLDGMAGQEQIEGDQP